MFPSLALQAANASGLLGYIIIGRKWRWGWLVTLVSEAMWGLWAALTGTWSLWPWVVIWSVVQFYNWRKWKQGDRDAVPSGPGAT